MVPSKMSWSDAIMVVVEEPAEPYVSCSTVLGLDGNPIRYYITGSEEAEAVGFNLTPSKTKTSSSDQATDLFLDGQELQNT